MFVQLDHAFSIVLPGPSCSPAQYVQRLSLRTPASAVVQAPGLLGYQSACADVLRSFQQLRTIPLQACPTVMQIHHLML